VVDFNRLGQFAFGLIFDGNLQPAFGHGDSHDVRAELHQAQGSRLRRALRIYSSAGGASLWGDFQQTGFLGHADNTASHVPENASGQSTGDFGPRPDFFAPATRFRAPPARTWFSESRVVTSSARRRRTSEK